MSEFHRYIPPDARSERPKTPEDVFGETLRDSTIERIDLSDIPPTALATLEKRSRYLVKPENYAPGNFTDLFAVTGAEGKKTFVARQRKKYSAEGAPEELTYVADLDEDGTFVGFGEIRLAIASDDPSYKDKPFVGFTETERAMRGRGFGERRLRTMNALTRMLYAQPLRSDTLISASAKRTWETLVAKGEAVAYRDNEHERYVFTDTQ